MKELALACVIIISAWMTFILLISFLLTIGIVLTKIGNRKINTESPRNSTELEEK